MLRIAPIPYLKANPYMPEQSSLNFLIDEIRDLRTRMDERFDTQEEKMLGLSSQVTVLNTQMKTIIGNGQPGVIQQIQSTQTNCRESCNGRLMKLENKRAEWIGKHTVVSSIAAALISLLIVTHDHWIALLKN